MKFRSKSRWTRVVELGAAAWFAAQPLPATACGPDFPSSYLASSDAELLAAPEGNFAAEIARLAGELPVAHRAVVAADSSPAIHQQKVEYNQLVEALLQAGCEPAEAGMRALEFAEWRSSLPAKPVPAPAGIPAEFILYAKGAAAWRTGDWTGAQAAWTALLALPEAERRHRTLWAAYMFGRAAGNDVATASTRPPPEALAEAHRWFALVRELAAAGWPDPLGLAAESYGWEARAALDTGALTEAANLYLRHYATGDASASASLRLTTHRLLEPTLDAGAVRDPLVRRLMLAYVVSRVGSTVWDDDPQPPFARWAESLATAIEQAGLGDVAEADRLAWLAYQAGRFELAERWAKLAPETAPLARWIRAKLALRAGRTAEGAALLGLAADDPQLAPALRAQADAELGRARLALGDFLGALAAWLRGGHWQDAAYVAERLLTTEELEAFIASHTPPTGPAQPRENAPAFGTSRPVAGWVPEDLGAALRHLLGRRLARAGRVEEAEPFLPENLRALARSYGADVRAGFDPERPAAERAAAFWRAAQTAREHGLELLGTELEPDWFIWGASFATEPAEALRRGTAQPAEGKFPPAELEFERLKEQPVPAKRFSYRYRAAELAGWAAALLPNDSEQAAEILDTAGRWLMQRDPEAANPFYQLLVLRCPHTELGRRAASRRWFPERSDAEAEADARAGAPPPAAEPQSRFKP